MSNQELHPQKLQAFIRSVLESERHFLSEENLQFLESLFRSSQSRKQKISKGSIYFRARINNDCPDKPIPKDEMIPKPGLKSEGRVNPYNVNVLYLSNKPGIAVAEVRPGLYEPTTVATFRVTRDLQLVDFTTEKSGYENLSAYEAAKNKPTETTADTETLTWFEINKCFSTSFTSSEARLNYIPTQIISEFFKSKGYDGVIYQSQFDMVEREDKDQQAKGQQDRNINIALFDMTAAEAMETRLYQIYQQTISVKEIICHPRESGDL